MNTRLFLVTVTVLHVWIASGSEVDSKNFELNDLLQVGGKVGFQAFSKPTTARTLSGNLDDDLESFLKSNEVSVDVPFISSTITFDGRSLDNGEFDFKLKANAEGAVEERKKKHKIKKILTPILVLLVLKAITLIPLALGILGIKTWNALQLSFVSFVVSIVLAVWKFCAKVADFHPPAPTVIHEAVHDIHPIHEVVHPHVYHDHHHPHHHYDDHHHHHHDDHHYDFHDHHLLWDPHYRSDDRSDAQTIAYNSYAPEANYKTNVGVGVGEVYKTSSDLYKTTQDL